MNKHKFSDKKTALQAGLIYLVVIGTGIFSLAYVPRQLIDWNNGNATFNNITAAPRLFRLGIYSSVVCYTAFIFLPLCLYNLLRRVNESLAKSMVILALLSVPLSFNNLQHKYAVLTLIDSAPMAQNISTHEAQGQLMLSLHHYNDGMVLAMVFWGLWLFPFGLLVYHSGFLPKPVGVFLVSGCIGYLVNFTGNTLSANYAKMGIEKYMGMLPAVGEISACLSLLYYAAKAKKIEQ